MKKMFLLAVTAILLFSACSKNKDELPAPPVSNIVFTDNPPASLFVQGLPYGTTYECWVDSTMLSEAKFQGDKCNYDSYSGQYYDCGSWYIMPARKFWGIIGEKIYLSTSKDWYAIGPQIYLRTTQVIKGKGTGIASMCYNCQNPLAINGQIMNMR